MINAKIFPWIRKSGLLLAHMILIFALGCGPATEIVIVFPTATSSITPTPEPTKTQLPTFTPAPPATPFIPAAVIKIFSQSPLSGEQAKFGQDILHGAELAIQQLSNPLFSEYRFKVELVPYDDQNSGKTAAANAQQIIADPEILCGIGHYDPQVTIETSDVYHLAGLALIAPSVTAPLLTKRDYREVNRLIGHSDGQGAAGAQFAAAQGFASVYIVSQQGESSLKNAEYFRLEADRRGIQTLGMRVAEVNSQNINQIISQIMDVKPELIYITSSADQALPFLNLLRGAGYMGAILGTERLNDPSMIHLADPSLVEGAGMYYTITNPPLQYFSDAATFTADFETQYGTVPSSFAARAYDATGACLTAIQIATKAKNGTPPTRDEVVRTIRRMRDYNGITGTFNFDTRGDPVLAQYYVVQITSLDAANWDQNSIIAAYDIAPP